MHREVPLSTQRDFPILLDTQPAKVYNFTKTFWLIMPVTIREVAKRLNLSITTVSRALDGYSDVAEHTRELVERTAHEMGYVPNIAARQLRRQRSDIIGFILPHHQPRFADPHYSEFIAGLGDEATRHDFDLLISTASPGEDEQQVYRRWVQGRKVDGLVLNRIRQQDWRVDYLSEQAFPFVSLERPLGAGDYSFIEVDGRSGFKTLLAHLVDQGHRRIAYAAGPPELKLQADRFAGYCAGLEAAGIPFDPRLVVTGNLTRQEGYTAGRALLALPEPPSAIVCVNDLTAIGVMQAAHELGLVVGEEVAIAGFDGIDEAENTAPPLTTLNQPLYEIASRLVRILLGLILEEPAPAVERQVRILPELILRGSTGD